MPPDEPTTGDGEPTTGEAVVAAIRAAPQPVVNTRYLANEFGLESDVLLEHLQRLVDEGVLESLEIRGRTRLWWCSLETELERGERGRDAG